MNVIHQQFNRSNAVYRLADGLAIILGLSLTLFQNPDLNSKATIVVCLATIGLFSIISEFIGMYRNWIGSRIAGELGCSILTWTATLVGLGFDLAEPVILVGWAVRLRIRRLL